MKQKLANFIVHLFFVALVLEVAAYGFAKNDIDGNSGDAGDNPRAESQSKPVTERASDKPYLEYGNDNTAKAIRNLMSGKGERVSFQGKVGTFTGKIVKIITPEVDDYKFTLALAGGKRENFYFYLPEPLDEFADAGSLIVQGNTVSVKALRCRKDGFLSPIEIIRQ